MHDEIEVKDDFDRLHTFVKENLKTWFEVGKALGEIRDRKLYLQGGHDSFKDYCRNEFQHDDRWARRLIQSSRLAEEHDVPTERAARELLKHPEEDRSKIVEIAKERQGENITSTMIQDVAWEVSHPPSTDTTVRPQTHEFNSIVNQIIQIAKKVNELGDEQIGAHLDMGQIRASLKTAHDYVKAGIPTHKCYACNGKGCKICKDMGWIPEAVFDRRPTEFV